MHRNKLSISVLIALAAAAGVPANVAADAPEANRTGTSRSFWSTLGTDSTSTSLRMAPARGSATVKHLALDFAGLSATLRQIPRQAPTSAAARSTLAAAGRLALPLPEGGTSQFTLEDSGTIPDELAARYPALRSFRGTDPAGRRARVDLATDTVSVSVEDSAGAWHIVPAASQGEAGRYDEFRRADAGAVGPFEPADMLKIGADAARGARANGNAQTDRSTGAVLYNFRLAVPATSGYASRFGGTREAALAGVVRATNQLNEIFENDLGVHLTLVSEEDRLIMTEPSTDPFGDLDNVGVPVDLMNRVVGEANYDIGILFTDEFGGWAGSIGNTCMSGPLADVTLHKGAGHTGHPNPVSDPSFVLIAAHELGHKMGAWHSFNGAPFATREESAWEPGSGSTIMSYAGTGQGGAQHQLQQRMDRYFHGGSIESMSSWLAGRGGRCASRRLNANDAPWIDPESILPYGRTRYTIPAQTPFALDADVLPAQNLATPTYVWEQMDTGPFQLGALRDTGRGPIFRSQVPGETPYQSFPSLPVVLGAVAPGLGEVYPATTRSLRFRLTARDNFGSLATTSSADTTIDVVDTGSAFAVRSPAGDATWRMGATRRVRWDVAGTRAAPVSCKKVDIHLSINGGYDYLDEALATGVANSGSAQVTMPTLGRGTSESRIRVRCSDNLFYAVSPGNFNLRR